MCFWLWVDVIINLIRILQYVASFMIDKELMQKKMIFLGQMLTLHIARQCFFRQFKMVKIVMSMALNDWHPV